MHIAHRASTLAVALLLGVAIPGIASARTADDPCVTVSKGDAAKAIGEPVVSMKPMTVGPGRACSFHGSKPFAAVVVTALRYDDPAQTHDRFVAMVAQTSTMMSPTVPLAGVGDEAKAIASSVYVRKAAAIYVFNVFGQRSAALTARATALARATLAHVH